MPPAGPPWAAGEPPLARVTPPLPRPPPQMPLQLRSTGSSAGTVDAYYFAPNGKRFRSRSEIAKHLGFDVPGGERCLSTPPPPPLHACIPAARSLHLALSAPQRIAAHCHHGPPALALPVLLPQAAAAAAALLTLRRRWDPGGRRWLPPSLPRRPRCRSTVMRRLRSAPRWVGGGGWHCCGGAGC